MPFPKSVMWEVLKVPQDCFKEWTGLDLNALFHVTKIVEKNHMHKMHNTSSCSYQSICLINVNIKVKMIIIIILIIIIMMIIIIIMIIVVIIIIIIINNNNKNSGRK